MASLALRLILICGVLRACEANKPLLRSNVMQIGPASEQHPHPTHNKASLGHALRLVQAAAQDGNHGSKAGRRNHTQAALEDMHGLIRSLGGGDGSTAQLLLPALSLSVGAGTLPNPASVVSDVTAILDTMDRSTNASHDAAQTYVNGLSASFNDCHPDQNATIDGFKNTYNNNLQPHKTCRGQEKTANSNYATCTEKKADFDDVNADPRPSQECAVVTGGESKEDWLHRMATEFDNANATWHAKRAAYLAGAAPYLPTFVGCDSAVHVQKKTACDAYLRTIEQNACSWAQGVKYACNGYADCYSGKDTAFDSALATARKQEDDRKIHFRGTQRIRCILGTFGNGSAGSTSSSTLQACLDAAASHTSHLDIIYPSKPGQQTCQEPTVYPCTASYNSSVFTGLPSGLVVPASCACELPSTTTTTTTAQIPDVKCVNTRNIPTLNLQDISRGLADPVTKCKERCDSYDYYLMGCAGYHGFAFRCHCLNQNDFDSISHFEPSSECATVEVNSGCEGWEQSDGTKTMVFNGHALGGFYRSSVYSVHS